MRVLLWHGYLLSGSGSNIYTANIAREWRAEGLDVLVMCQDRLAADLEFVDADGDFTEDNKSVSFQATGAPRAAGAAGSPGLVSAMSYPSTSSTSMWALRRSSSSI